MKYVLPIAKQKTSDEVVNSIEGPTFPKAVPMFIWLGECEFSVITRFNS